MPRSPYPLSWPDGWPRTRHRERSNFDLGRGFPAARDGAFYQLSMMHASHVVITSNLPTNASGKPYTSSQGNIPDPGIAVWWVQRGEERVIACDRWLSATENMRAIEKSLEAMRGLSRWGATQIVERAFAGFAALPPPSGPEIIPTPKLEHWRDIFDMRGPVEGMSKRDQIAVVRARHRDRIKAAHPDAGGSEIEAMKLNAALDVAIAELSK